MSSKPGRSGPLAFVKVRHEVRCNGAAEPVLVRVHDIVCSAAKRPGDEEPLPQPAPVQADWVLQQPALDDPRSTGNANRLAHSVKLRTSIVEAFSKLTPEMVVLRLEPAQIAKAQLRDVVGLWQHPQLRARHAGGRWIPQPARGLRCSRRNPGTMVSRAWTQCRRRASIPTPSCRRLV